MSGEMFNNGEQCKFGSYKWLEKCFFNNSWILLEFLKIKTFTKVYVQHTGFHKCPTEFYFFQQLSETHLEYTNNYSYM